MSRPDATAAHGDPSHLRAGQATFVPSKLIAAGS